VLISDNSAKLYYLQDGKIWSANLDGGQSKLVVTAEGARSFDYHYMKKKIYWIDDENRVSI